MNQIHEQVDSLGNTKPIPVSIEGFGSEVTEILKFDLYVQGFTFVTPDAAQYQISGTSAGNVVGRVVDRFGKSTILSRSYNGATLRRQAHAFADDVVLAITGKKGIAQTRIAFKVEASSGNGEIYVADFDGHNCAGRDARWHHRFRAVVGARPGGPLLQFLQTRTTRTFFTTISIPANGTSSRITAVPTSARRPRRTARGWR